MPEPARQVSKPVGRLVWAPTLRVNIIPRSRCKYKTCRLLEDEVRAGEVLTVSISQRLAPRSSLLQEVMTAVKTALPRPQAFGWASAAHARVAMPHNDNYEMLMMNGFGGNNPGHSIQMQDFNEFMDSTQMMGMQDNNKDLNMEESQKWGRLS